MIMNITVNIVESPMHALALAAKSRPVRVAASLR